MGFPVGSDGKESTCNAGDPGLIPESRRSPAEGNGNPLQYSYLENSMDRPWCHKESDTTEQLIHMKCLGYAFPVTLRVQEFSILN